MRLIQVTIGASATPVEGANPPIDTIPTQNGVVIQNNAAHNCAYGDSTVTITSGIVVPFGAPGTPQILLGKIDLSKLYLAGTQNDVINVFAF